MQIQQRLKEMRIERGKTQENIAKLLGIEKQNYYRYEKGKSPLKAEQIKIICEYLNISADYILGLTDEKRPLK